VLMPHERLCGASGERDLRLAARFRLHSTSASGAVYSLEQPEKPTVQRSRAQGEHSERGVNRRIASEASLA